MNRILVFVFLLLSIGSLTAYQQSNKDSTVIHNDKIEKINIDKDFELQLQMEKLDNGLYDLSATISLAKGSYIISPFSTDSIYLHFAMSIPPTYYLISDNKLSETPNSIPEIDPILNEPVRFVRGKTTYKQQIKVINENDFEVSGLIEFLVEPVCVPYDVEFTISKRSGIVTVKKTKTYISKEYKGTRGK